MEGEAGVGGAAWRGGHGRGGASWEGPGEGGAGSGGGAKGAHLLGEQRATGVTLARVLAPFEVSDGADHRVDEVARVAVVFALGVGEQREVDGVQHVGQRAAFSEPPPPRHRDGRVGAAVAPVVEQGHSDRVDAADRLRQEARERDVRRREAAGRFARARGSGGTCKRRRSVMSFSSVKSLYSGCSYFSAISTVSAQSCSPLSAHPRAWRCTPTCMLSAGVPWVQCAAVMAHCSSMSEAPHIEPPVRNRMTQLCSNGVTGAPAEEEQRGV